jgi:hypothetical protein
MSTTHNRIAMSPDELPRQRLFRVLDLPEPPEGFEFLGGATLAKLTPNEPGAGATLVVQAEWAWSPMHSRISNWEIGLDDSGQYWVLWCSSPSDEYERVEPFAEDDEAEAEWVEIWSSQLVAACAKGQLSISDAAVLLLLQAWPQDRLDTGIDRPHFYGATGVLGIDVLRSIEQVVWAE